MGLFDFLKRKKVVKTEPETDDSAPGWDAIDSVFERLYPNQEPRHLGAKIYRHLDLTDNPSAFDGLSIYDAGEFWHYVSYGLTELYGKESENIEFSGFGYELTMKIKKDSESEPPMWAVEVMSSIGKAQWNGSDFYAGHTVKTGPINGATDTVQNALAIFEDPELKTIETPHGKVSFYVLLGINNSVREEILENGFEVVSSKILEKNPKLITKITTIEN